MKLSVVEFRPCNMIQFEKVHSATSSTRLGTVSDLKKKTPVQFCVRVAESFEIIQCLSVGSLEQFLFNKATGIRHLRLMVELLAFCIVTDVPNC
jgi:hypothetical protein